jgi:drug/metabolite transporter (DMT)-like permease
MAKLTLYPSGEIAALMTAVCWSIGSLAFTAAGRRIGSRVVNLLRMALACVLLTVAAWLLRGQALPLDASREAWGWLVLSGLVGFSLGDLCLFRAYVLLGARLTSLLMSLAPLFAAILGLWLLGEQLAWRDLAGISATLAGIALALTERHEGGLPADDRQAAEAGGKPPLSGILLALGGAVGQGGGLVLSKIGLLHYTSAYAPLAATQIRVLAGLAGFALMFSLGGWWRQVGPAFRDQRALVATAVGSFFGPFVGVTLSLYAVAHAPAGVASSLMATSPLLILPATVLLQGERVGWRAVAGTVIAVAGVALLVS